MSVIKTAKKLVENHLKTIVPSIPIAFENVTFNPPSDGSKYLRCSLVTKKPDDTCIGSNYYRQPATFNIFVMDKLNIGTGSALDTAEIIQQLFNKKTTLEENNVRVQVLETPYIAGTAITTDRLVVPVSVQLTIENLV